MPATLQKQRSNNGFSLSKLHGESLCVLARRIETGSGAGSHARTIQGFMQSRIDKTTHLHRMDQGELKSKCGFFREGISVSSSEGLKRMVYLPDNLYQIEGRGLKVKMTNLHADLFVDEVV